MTRLSFLTAALVAAALATAPAVATAQPLSGPSCTTSTTCAHTLSATVPTLVNLTLENAATSLGTITAAQFDNGQRVDGPRFEARANRTYSVTLVAASPTFSGSGNAAKSAGDVRFAVVTSAAGCSAAGAFTPVPTAAAAGIFSGGAGLSARQQLCFNIVWNYETDAPGTYDLGLNLNVTAP
jgi:hypothetical protein